MTIDNSTTNAMDIPARKTFMRKTGYLLSVFLVILLAAGCNGDSNGATDDGGAGGDADAGPECLTDADCTPPETCQADNTCAYIPDPDDNKAGGAFDLQMDYAGLHGAITVSGKFDGMYLYMNYGGLVEYNQTEDRTEMQIFGLVTNQLLNALVIHLPRDCPTGQSIKFGAGGVAIGTLDRAELDSDGYEIKRTSVGEIIDGTIAFSDYDYNAGSPVVGTLQVSFRVIK
jgi:hypothetical protein